MREHEETPAEEFSRLIIDYNEGGKLVRAEAWHLIADFAMEHSDTILRALRAPSPSPAPGVVEDDAETLKSRVAAVLCEAGALCGWPAPNCNAREGAEALFKAGLLALASLSQPAKEREGEQP